MFFPERIKGIKPGDKVLEIGPGSTPHPRSNVLLEKKYDTEEEYNAQTGYNGTLNTKQQVVFYDGDRFPFEDDSFDYVICSHVLEHIADVPGFMAEITRVAKRGYFEFPTIYYDYLYNFPVHTTFLLKREEGLYYMLKSESPLSVFQPVQNLLYHSLETGHVDLVDDLKEYLFQGFEWEGGIRLIKTLNISELCYLAAEIRLNKKRSASVGAVIRKKVKGVVGKLAGR